MELSKTFIDEIGRLYFIDGDDIDWFIGGVGQRSVKKSGQLFTQTSWFWIKTNG